MTAPALIGNQAPARQTHQPRTTQGWKAKMSGGGTVSISRLAVNQTSKKTLIYC